ERCTWTARCGAPRLPLSFFLPVLPFFCSTAPQAFFRPKPPRFLVHDRDSCYGATFDRRVRNIGIAQVCTPFSSPRANAIAERWVRSVRSECLDHVFIFNEPHLQRVLTEYERQPKV